MVDGGSTDPDVIADPVPNVGDAAVADEVEVVPLVDEGGDRRDLKAEATSVTHLLTHWPKSP